MENKDLINESLNKIHSMMNFKPGMTKTELREILENGLKAEMQESSENLPSTEEVAEEEVAEVDVAETKEEEVAETKEEEVVETKEEEVIEVDVAETKEDVEEEKDKVQGATNMAIGFAVTESVSNKEQKRINKEVRLNKKMGRV